MDRIKLLKALNFLKNLDSLKEKMYKLSFMYYYKIVNTKKLLSHL